MRGNPIPFIRHAVPCHQIKITIWLAVIYSSKIEFTRREGKGVGGSKNKNITSHIYILLQTESSCPGNSDTDVTSLHNCCIVKTPRTLEL